MAPRTIKRNLINSRAEIIGNKKTIGHGLISEIPPTIKVDNSTIIPTINNSNQLNNKYLKILKPKSYISFD
jgi:hypothetical protein